MNGLTKEDAEQIRNAGLKFLEKEIYKVDKQLTSIEAQFEKAVDFNPDTLSLENAERICTLASLYLDSLDQAMTMTNYYFLKTRKIRTDLLTKEVYQKIENLKPG